MKKTSDIGKRERVLIVEGTGKKVRHGEVVRGLVKKTAIEVAGDRRYVVCKQCGITVEVARTGRRRLYCADCRKARDEANTRKWIAERPEKKREYEKTRYPKRRADDLEAYRKYHREYAAKRRAAAKR